MTGSSTTGNIQDVQRAATLSSIYGAQPQLVAFQEKRYQALLERFLVAFGAMTGGAEPRFFRTPGRTEIGGNHTDHNHGRVLAASVNLDAVAVAAPSGDHELRLNSVGYPPITVDLNELAVKPHEVGTTQALLRGVAARFVSLGRSIGGLCISMDSDVLQGSGLSSSAAVEVLFGSVLNDFFNDGVLPPVELAQIAQYSENEYFGKPCGLMDQVACAVGGMVAIDFEEPSRPIVEKIDYDFSAVDHALLVVDTGGSHANLTPDYAAIPDEMKSVATFLGKSVCREICVADLLGQAKVIRAAVGDRAWLRAFHYLQENERVVSQVQALRDGDFQGFLGFVTDSGRSSSQWLQNIFTTTSPAEQGVSVGLAMSEYYLREVKAGACRVHGGGFAGTIQAWLPNAHVSGYVSLMESAFGPGSVVVLSISPVGTTRVEIPNR